MFKDPVARDCNAREPLPPLLDRLLTPAHVVSLHLVAVRAGDDAEYELFLLLRIETQRRAQAIVAEGPPHVVPHFGAERELRVTIDEIDAAVAGLDIYRRLLLATSRLRLLNVGEVCTDRPGEVEGDGVSGAIDDDERGRHFGDAHSQC